MASAPLPLGDRAAKCPSSQVDFAESEVFGVVLGTPERPEVAYLERTVPVTPELLAPLREASVPPPAALRVAAPCLSGACSHFDGASCSLANKVVRSMPSVVERLAPCAIRSTCRWFRQEGAEVCKRCAGIVTRVADPSAQELEIAEPLFRRVVTLGRSP